MALALPLPLLITLGTSLALRCLLIRNNRLLPLPVYLRVLLVGRQPRRLQEPLRGALQPGARARARARALPRGPGCGRTGGVLLVRVARQREFPGEFLVADAAGARVAAEGPQVVGWVGGVGAWVAAFFGPWGEGLGAAGAQVEVLGVGAVDAAAAGGRSAGDRWGDGRCEMRGWRELGMMELEV